MYSKTKLSRLFEASYHCYFSSAWQKSNQKKTPVTRFILRVVDPDGARGNSPRWLAGLRQSARFFPSDPPMLGAGQREETPKQLKACKSANTT